MQSAYQIAVGVWNIAPTDFWQMSVQEWFLLFDAKRTDKQVHDWEADTEMLQELGIKKLTRPSTSAAQAKAMRWTALLGTKK